MYGIRARDLAALIIRGWLLPTTGIIVILVGAYLAVGHIKPATGAGTAEPEQKLRLVINQAAMRANYGVCSQELAVVTWDVRGNTLRIPVTIHETHLPSTGFGPIVVMCGSEVSPFRGAPSGAPYFISVVANSARSEP